MGTIQTKTHKINWLKSTIKAFFEGRPDESIDLERLIAEFILVHGSTRRTALEILDIFEKTNAIRIEEGLIINGKQKSNP